MEYIFTSESVSEGHPDKIADKISDSILDKILSYDKNARVACETFVKTGMVLVGGEINTTTWVDVEEIARNTVLEIGYDSSEKGFDGASCAVLNAIGKQSPDISQGVDKELPKDLGAGDQGLMFGYACNETKELMPAPIHYSHRLMEKHKEVRKNKIDWLLPDAKCQLTFRYKDDKPIAVDKIVFSTQHSESSSLKMVNEAVREEIIKKVIPLEWLNDTTEFFINPTGKFIIGGPMGDCGLTGRKIIVDTYGGMARHGGGCFSGKDPSKVDRSAAYMGRYIAKNLVSAGIADKIEIQLSYAIGVPYPMAINVNTFNTGKLPNNKIVEIINENFDTSPWGIITELDLLKPIYANTSCFGHFGRENHGFSWEKLTKVATLKKYL